jgi:hypothetical protein
MYIKRHESFTSADRSCANLGGKLASIHSKEEFDWLGDIMKEYVYIRV